MRDVLNVFFHIKRKRLGKTARPLSLGCRVCWQGDCALLQLCVWLLVLLTIWYAALQSLERKTDKARSSYPQRAWIQHVQHYGASSQIYFILCSSKSAKHTSLVSLTIPKRVMIPLAGLGRISRAGTPCMGLFKRFTEVGSMCALSGGVNSMCSHLSGVEVRDAALSYVSPHPSPNPNFLLLHPLLHCGSRKLEQALPMNPPWYKVFNTTDHEIFEISAEILQLYKE